MSTTPGWYADPDPESAPDALRWWDGRQWTEQVRPGPQQPGPQQAGPQQAGSQQQVQLTKPAGPGQVQPGHHPGAQPAFQAVPPTPPVTHTPDGMALASVWKRLGAALLDGLIVTVLSFVLVFGFVAVVFGGGALTGSFDPSSSGEPPPEFFVLLVIGYLLLLAGSALLGIWYYVIRVRQVGATLGKQVLGMRVRTFHTDGQLTWAQVWARYGIPAIVNSVVGITYFVDSLWLLWDPHRQTLHDKLVGTVVVDTTAPRLPPDHPAVQHARAVPVARGWMCDGPNPQTPAGYAR